MGHTVLRQAFQGVDASDADIDLVVANLIDRVAEPIGDLPFPADLHMAPRCNRASHDQEPGQSLQQRGSDAVLQLRLRLRLLEYHAFLRARHPPRLALESGG